MRALITATILALGVCLCAAAQDAKRAFEHAYYLEHAKRDYAGAAAAYRKALPGFAGDKAMALRCRVRLAGCLLELGKTAEAQAVLAPLSAEKTEGAGSAAKKKPQARIAWRRALPGPIEALLVGARYAAVRDGKGRLHVLDGEGRVRFTSAHAKTAISDGMRPLAWHGDRLLVAGTSLIGVFDAKRRSWVNIWESRIAGGVAGGWLDKTGVAVAGRDGGVFARGASAPQNLKGKVRSLLRYGNALFLVRESSVELWDLSRGAAVRWNAPIAGGPVRSILGMGSTLVCLQADRVVALEMTTGKTLAVHPVKGSALCRTSDRRGALVLRGGTATRIDIPGKPAAIPIPSGAPSGGAGWLAERLLVAERDAVVAVAPAVKLPAPGAWEAGLRAKLQRKVTLDFSNAPLVDVLNFLSETTKIDIVIASPDKRDAKITMHVRDLEVEKALSLMLHINGLKWAPKCGAIVVGHESVLKRFAPPLRPGAGLPDAAAWRAIAVKKMTVDFTETPASDVFAFVQQVTRLNMVLGDESLRRRSLTLRARNLPVMQVVALCAGMIDARLEFRAGVLLLRARPKTTQPLFHGRTEPGARAAVGGGNARSEMGVRNALAWLARHQDENGMWDGDGFMKHDPPRDVSSGAAKMGWVDPGLTALATLAFLGAGNTDRAGDHRANVARAVAWLRKLQAADGRIGGKRGHYLYNHAIATLALCELYGMTRDVRHRGAATKAAQYLVAARNPGGAWRYQERSGDSDVSVSAWAVQALVAARAAKLEVAGLDAALREVQTWLDGLTAPMYGAVGYKNRPPRGWSNATSSRFVNDEMRVNTANTHSPNHTPTAIALLCHRLMGRAADDRRLTKSATLVAGLKPEAKHGSGGKASKVDHYYWYFGTSALYQVGGQRWKDWNTAMHTAVLGSQQADGSWAPRGAWGFAGGRVYATAINALTLEVYYRYARVQPR